MTKHNANSWNDKIDSITLHLCSIYLQQVTCAYQMIGILSVLGLSSFSCTLTSGIWMYVKPTSRLLSFGSQNWIKHKWPVKHKTMHYNKWQWNTCVPVKLLKKQRSLESVCNHTTTVPVIIITVTRASKGTPDHAKCVT